MTSYTDVVSVTEETRMRYHNRFKDSLPSGTRWTRKVAFRESHPNARTHWISFYKEAHTPVVIGTVIKTS
jgi:hypothetical protein